MSPRVRVVNGMRPTGRLHLGNLFGSLVTCVKLQEAGTFECFFFIADWHAITTGYDAGHTRQIPGQVREMVADWLAAGLDPERSVIFLQSDVPEHAELALLLGMVTPVSWLERNPTYKEMQEELKDRELSTLGFLGYPVLQAADIVVYRGQQVPVGKDQVPHLELTREIVRRFNGTYGNGGEVFPEPQPLLTETPLLPGTDNRKMSKSYGNCLYPSDPPEATRAAVRKMYTDPLKVRKGDPGRPETCPVFTFHKLVNAESRREPIASGCRSGSLGCVDCKQELSDRLEAAYGPWRAKREEALRGQAIEQVLARGAERARAVARHTLADVRQAVFGGRLR